MILQGTTPRALSATGFLALAAVAALMLPLMPTWAQEPEPRKVRIGVQVQGADEDEAIAELKKRLAELEARRAQKKVGADGKKAEQIEKARAEVKAAAERLRAAMTRLAELEGGPLFLGIEAGPGKLMKGVQEQTIIRTRPADMPKVLIRKRIEGKSEETAATRPGSSEERLNRLEKQLGELLREVQELRKERKK